MKIAFVVPRYGLEIVGGAEYHARVVAEHLKRYHQIEVLTTCARDYRTWKNEYKEGIKLVNGIKVRQFKNKQEREINKFREIEEKVFHHIHGRDDEIAWINEQGPYCENLIEYIKNNKKEYDCYIFFTFRYYPTYYGIKSLEDKALIAPLAEDDPALNLTTTREIFETTKGIIYNAPEERELILKKVNFQEKEKIWDVVGCGIEIPTNLERLKRSMDGDYILYLGRIDGSKGCFTLFEYYQKAIAELKEIPKLILAGYNAIEIPNHEKIKYVGFISEEEKIRLLKNAKFLVMPSPYESLSLVTLEAMACGTPVLVNGECEVLKGHCLRSNAGLWYRNYGEFKECLKFLCSNEEISKKMGENGRVYVENNYSWKNIEEKYLQLLEKFKENV